MEESAPRSSHTSFSVARSAPATFCPKTYGVKLINYNYHFPRFCSTCSLPMPFGTLSDPITAISLSEP